MATPPRPPTNTLNCYRCFLITSLSIPRSHIHIFLETNAYGPGTGYIFQVSGSIQQGMYRNDRECRCTPEEDVQSLLEWKESMGCVRKDDYEMMGSEKGCDVEVSGGEMERNGEAGSGDGSGSRFMAVLNSVEVPVKQYNGPKRLYPTRKIRRCGEWAREAVEALRTEGVLLEADHVELTSIGKV